MFASKYRVLHSPCPSRVTSIVSDRASVFLEYGSSWVGYFDNDLMYLGSTVSFKPSMRSTFCSEVVCPPHYLRESLSKQQASASDTLQGKGKSNKFEKYRILITLYIDIIDL